MNLRFNDYRRFGRLRLLNEEDLQQHPGFKNLGPEPLEIESRDFVDRLRTRRGRVKSLLLDQSFLAGLGNIYADEALHASGIHPLTSAHRLRPNRARRLHRSIQTILPSALRAGGASIENFRRPSGELGWFQESLKVYGREGEECLRCGRSIRRIVVGQRGTWFCPRCQRKGRPQVESRRRR